VICSLQMSPLKISQIFLTLYVIAKEVASSVKFYGYEENIFVAGAALFGGNKF
jgi:hypothetical protein